MLSFKEKGIMFYLSIIIPIEICSMIIKMKRKCEFEDAREEHMNDCSYYLSISNLTGSGSGKSSCIMNYMRICGYNWRLFKHVDADIISDSIPQKIKRLSCGSPMYDMSVYSGNITQFPYSLLNEGNPELASATVSQSLLKRAIKENRYYTNIIDDPIININIPYYRINEVQDNKKNKAKKLKHKIMKQNNPPVKRLYKKTFKHQNMNRSIKFGKKGMKDLKTQHKTSWKH